jgi:hypothetical protein
MPELNDEIMNDGSRHFLLLPVGGTHPLKLLARVFTLWGAFPTAYVPGMAETWIDFRFKGYKFSINDQFGDYWFFVRDPECPVNLLTQVATHFEEALEHAP